MFRVPPTLLKVLLICFCLSATTGGQGLLASLSTDLLQLLLRGDERPVRAILRGDVSAIQLAAERDGIPVLKVLDGFVVVSAPPSVLSVLRVVPGVLSISRDLPVAPAMTVSDKAMAADQARLASGGLLGLGGLPAVNGSGIGVAVVDSGIAPHSALAGKVVKSVSFVTGDPGTTDGFGHGTHIAGIIAGLATTGVTSLYKNGVAPGAHLVNVRVLGNNGVGYTSDVIAGIQWVIAHKSQYGVRVMNLSLGHPSAEPCLTDPLCITVEQAAASGLVVVVSAGNSGKNAAGQQVLASITTPGNSPSAITVGALNTWGTVSRDDDTVATYSSRGPTKYELGLKPDVVAPGNKIVSLEAAGSYLATRYPSQHVAGGGMNGYFVMSGTSMAAAMVSGGVALMLNGAPALTVRQVKVALQLSASFMPKEALIASGTGSVNLYSARRVDGALTNLTGIIPPVTVGGRTVKPGGLLVSDSGSLVDRAYGRVGMRLLPALDMLQGWLSPTGPVSRVSLLGLLNPLSTLPPASLVWGELASRVGGSQIVWSEQILSPIGQQIVWSEQVLATTGQQIVWSEAITAGQQIVWSEVLNPAGQQIVWSEQLLGASAQQIVWSETAFTNGFQIVWSEGGLSEGYQIVWSEQNTQGQQIVWSETLPPGGGQ